MKRAHLFAVGLVLLLWGATAFAEPKAQSIDQISPAGQKLVEFLDKIGVDHLWLAGHQVVWETGEPSDKPIAGAGKSTHCSAFAAAVADRLGIYLLRPPEHKQELLANAQYKWLEEDGKAKGWEEVASAIEAQARANEGELVVVVFRSPDPKKPGHIAVVRPTVMTVEELDATGPTVIQAGRDNHVSTTVREGFKHHAGAWDETGKGVKFYAHGIPEKG